MLTRPTAAQRGPGCLHEYWDGGVENCRGPTDNLEAEVETIRGVMIAAGQLQTRIAITNEPKKRRPAQPASSIPTEEAAAR